MTLIFDLFYLFETFILHDIFGLSVYEKQIKDKSV